MSESCMQITLKIYYGAAEVRFTLVKLWDLSSCALLGTVFFSILSGDGKKRCKKKLVILTKKYD